LFGGVLLVGLLIGGYLFWYYETGQDTIDGYPSQWELESTMCTGRVGDSCVGGAESVNLSEIESCYLPNFREIRNLPSVEGVNESTFVVTCDTSASSASN
jgi:hypothetical protein